MNVQTSRSRQSRGFTLIEISLVIALIVTLGMGIGISLSSMQGWEKAKAGTIALQAVYAAQRAYMADHPTADIATVPVAQLQAYLPQGWTTIPTATGANGETLVLDRTVMPPKFRLGTSTYDPSGSATDGLWDVGE